MQFNEQTYCFEEHSRCFETSTRMQMSKMVWFQWQIYCANFNWHFKHTHFNLLTETRIKITKQNKKTFETLNCFWLSGRDWPLNDSQPPLQLDRLVFSSRHWGQNDKQTCNNACGVITVQWGKSVTVLVMERRQTCI